MGNGKVVLRNGDKTVRIAWHPTLVWADEDDKSLGLVPSATQLDIDASSSSLFKVHGKRTRYFGDADKLAQIVARYMARGFVEDMK